MLRRIGPWQTGWRQPGLLARLAVAALALPLLTGAARDHVPLDLGEATAKPARGDKSGTAQRPRISQSSPKATPPNPQPPATEARPVQAARQQPEVPAVAADGMPRESVQADVSLRSVPVTASFTGTEIVIFGTVEFSRQPSAEAGLYDIVIVVEGPPSRLTARRKSRTAGIWINTQSVNFESVPSYYTILSTRPLDEVGGEPVLRENEIGFQHVRMTLAKGHGATLTGALLQEFREAVVRLKRKENLYAQQPHGVAFIGRSLFRASVKLPANVKVGPFETRVFLLRDGELLGQYRTRLDLERDGVQRYLHTFAFDYSLFYGIASVIIAVASGLLASTLFRRGGSH